MTESPRSPLELHVLTHTHWDREWYRSAEEFRLALVDLVDEVLDGHAGPHFLLDGQGIVLEDYLAVRPERWADLSLALREQQVEAGPWYVLGDNLIPGGEALIRNLLVGRDVLRRLRAVAPPVLYCPDAFGHPAALPILAAGFGFGVCIVWRGYGGPQWPRGDVARWSAADGSDVLLYHLPPDGYETGASLPTHPDASARRWHSLRLVLQPRATLGVALLPNGADHHAVQRGREEALRALAAAAAPSTVTVTTLTSFGRQLTERAANVALPAVRGELRDSRGYVWSLQGTFGARAAQKRANAFAERLLVHEVEPFAALARWNGGASRRHEARAFWRTLLACHPHDTLCGCSTDEVAHAMDERLAQVRRTGALAAQRARLALLGHDGAAAREREGEWSPVVVVWNRLPRARGGLCEVSIDELIGMVPVGPGSGVYDEQPKRSAALVLGSGAIPIQELSRTRVHVREESPRHYPRNALVSRHRVLAWIPDVAPLGLSIIPLLAAKKRAAAPPTQVTVENGTLDNGCLRVWIDVGGQLSISTRDGALWSDVLAFESVGERGDLYTHSSVPGTECRGRLVRHSVTLRGSLRTELTLQYRVPIGARTITSATGDVVRRRAGSVRLEVGVQLDAGASAVRLDVRGVNSAHDQRLRLVVRSGIARPDVWADAAFGALSRPVAAADEVSVASELPSKTSSETPSETPSEPSSEPSSEPPSRPSSRPSSDTPSDTPSETHSETHSEAQSEASWETPTACAPLHRFVSCFGANRGLSVISDGLGEYEATVDGDVAVTLVRAVGELSRRDVPERPGHAGWPVPTPAAQCLGPFAATLALFPHGPRTPEVLTAIVRMAEEELLPLVGETWRAAIDPPTEVIGPTLEGDGLAYSACKESEDGLGVVLRCVNQLDRVVEGAWRLPHIRQAWLARLDETLLGSLSIDGDCVRFSAPPHAVVTIVLRRA
ncbi:MAG: hypothetical protein Q8K82_19275 [Gemmatimonadaceae bacterium]|nr:hypothetical protein [Gemmatimonadaceae bacterium]